jgi:hypothetical protein
VVKRAIGPRKLLLALLARALLRIEAEDVRQRTRIVVAADRGERAMRSRCQTSPTCCSSSSFRSSSSTSNASTATPPTSACGRR